MSYDIYLRSARCPTCDHKPVEPDLPGPTYNLTPIFDLALTGEDLPNPDVTEGQVVIFKKPTDRPRGLRLLSGKKAKDTASWIRKALNHLADPEMEETFRALEPANKWGTLETARKVMAELYEAACEYRESTWEIQ